MEDRWNCDPETCFCARPCKHPDSAIVPEGSVKSRQSVLGMPRRSSHLKINRIGTLVDCHENAEATRSELEELGDLAKDEEDLGDVSRATDKTEQDIPPADTKLGTTGKHDRLDNTLRLNG